MASYYFPNAKLAQVWWKRSIKYKPELLERAKNIRFVFYHIDDYEIIIEVEDGD